MNGNRIGSGSLTILQIVVAVYLVTLGITGISAYNSHVNEFVRSVFGGGQGSLNLVVALLELVAGIMVFLSLLPIAGTSVRYAACLISAVLWIIWVLYSLVFHNAFEPNLTVWLNRLALDLVVGLVLWMIAVQYR